MIGTFVHLFSDGIKSFKFLKVLLITKLLFYLVEYMGMIFDGVSKCQMGSAGVRWCPRVSDGAQVCQKVTDTIKYHLN